MFSESCIIQLDSANFNPSKTMLFDIKKGDLVDPQIRTHEDDDQELFFNPQDDLRIYASQNGMYFEVNGGFFNCFEGQTILIHGRILEFQMSDTKRKLHLCGITSIADDVIYPISRNPDVVGTQIMFRGQKTPAEHSKHLLVDHDHDDIVQLPNGTVIYSLGEVLGGQEGRVTHIFVCGKSQAGMIINKLIVTIPMPWVKIRVAGTRVFCYNNDDKLRCNFIIVFDVWNPASVGSDSENQNVVIIDSLSEISIS